MSINQDRMKWFQEDLSKAFAIQNLVIEDESHLHAGHAGAASGGPGISGDESCGSSSGHLWRFKPPYSQGNSCFDDCCPNPRGSWPVACFTLLLSLIFYISRLC
jgi:hypothetical protein